MKRIDFHKQFRPYQLFHTRSIFLLDSWFSTNQLTRWKKKWLLNKLQNWWWIFADVQMNEKVRLMIAWKIYQPSYISLEKGLSYYNLIPESVFSVTSVSTRRTQQYQISELGFTYQKIPPSLFRWYKKIERWWAEILIGEVEKVLLDYFYLHADQRSFDDIVWLRINPFSYTEQVNEEKLLRYANLYPQTVQKTIALLHAYCLDYVHDAAD